VLREAGFTFKAAPAMLDGDTAEMIDGVVVRGLRRWLPLLAVVALLAGAGAAASMSQLPLFAAQSGPLAEGGELERHDPLDPPSEAPQEVAESVAMPSWVMPVVIGAGVLVAVVLLMVLVGAVVHSGSRFRRRSLRVRSAAKPGAADVGAEVVAALDAGLQQLDETDGDPRRAVIACWVRLESAAGAAGTGRLPGDTSTDLVLRLLAGHNLSAAVLTGFADVYRQARYASHEVDETMREQAKAALGRLREELTGVGV
jgi:hypothetical protein